MVMNILESLIAVKIGQTDESFDTEISDDDLVEMVEKVRGDVAQSFDLFADILDLNQMGINKVFGSSYDNVNIYNIIERILESMEDMNDGDCHIIKTLISWLSDAKAKRQKRSCGPASKALKA